MIRNNICIRDYETGSKNRHKCQPIQIAAVMIDIRRLEVIQDSLFESLILPEFDDEKCLNLGIDPLEDEALKINGHTRESLADAPHAKLVWEQYLAYLKDYNIKGQDGGAWNAPAIGGYNSCKFDDVIDIRMCELYGPKLNDWGDWSMYHPFLNFDVQHLVQNFFHATKINNTDSISMDAMREFFGYKKDGAHDAETDVIQTADMLIRFLKLTKGIVAGTLDLPKGKKVKFRGCVGGKI